VFVLNRVVEAWVDVFVVGCDDSACVCVFAGSGGRGKRGLSLDLLRGHVEFLGSSGHVGIVEIVGIYFWS